LRVDNDGYFEGSTDYTGPFAARFYGIMLVDLPDLLVTNLDILSPTYNREYFCESGIDGLFGNGGVGGGLGAGVKGL